MASVTADDSPITLRQNSSQRKGKRLKLYPLQDQHHHSRELRRSTVRYVQEDSNSDDDDDDEEEDEEVHQTKQFARNSRQYKFGNQEELPCEADGVRRSTRKKNLSYMSMNQSWIFGTGSIKVVLQFDYIHP